MKIYYRAFISLLVLFCTSKAYAYTYNQLISMLNSPDTYTRGIAAEALGDIGAQSVGPVLTNALKTDESSYVKARAAEALGKLNYKKAIPSLINALFERRGYLTRYAALSLGQLKAKAAVMPLEWVLNDKKGNDDNQNGLSADNRPWVDFNIEDRSSAADALGMIGDQSATNTLINNLQDPNYTIRLHCVLALGLLKSPDSYNAVKIMFNDTNPRVQAAARIALNSIPSPTPQQTNYYNSLRRSDYSKYRAAITKPVFNLNR